jgi:hypothetical protein
MTQVRLTGGCQCGAVRFSATGPFRAAICHCRMCQKAFGNYFAPLITVAGIDWTRGAPGYFRSSNKARRGFCQRCGTPLCYVGDDGWIEMAGGALDDPSATAPTVQFNVKSKVAFFDALARVPHHAREDQEVAFEVTLIGNQHPDHDTEHWPSSGRAT